jgi:endonuclease/exonuclease/phosphatase (EEP) superfamily protein YafD
MSVADEIRPDPAAPTPNRAALRWQSLRRLALIGGFGASLALVLAVVVPRPWPLCLLTPLVPQWMFLALVGGAVGLATSVRRARRPRLANALLALPLIVACASGVLFRGDRPRLAVPTAHVDSTAGGVVLKVMAANVHSGNDDHAAVVRWIAAERPDVVLLTEITSDWLRDLAVLDSDYPHRQVMPDDAGNFGMGFWSKHEIASGVFELMKPADAIGMTDTPQLDATIALPGGERVRLLGLHPLPPVRPSYAAARDTVLATVAGRIEADAATPTIVLGDLNATRYCAALRELAAVAGLKDALPHVRTSWPNRWSWPIMGIRIDHVLVDRHWIVQDARVGPDVGSDHWPLVVTARRVQ